MPDQNEYSTPIPQGAAIAAPASGSAYSVPVPQGASLTDTQTQQQSPADEAAQRSDEYKRNVYSQAHTDFSAGNYRKAASDLLKLFDNPDQPSISGIGKGFLKAGAETLFAAGK